eukprot:CAMPEP_0117450118 /NCGR_PEP_ID=MMETSP0759-20121206/8299_1 /TAXON_ID=63605 /ORGANISM="Percolomonas cosmopolitus, Strain WS" /LENGTH=238 /DNA_ID=CAMNT_0005242621 /DNA_START=34 /DNA_END=750 /DNA_ORIENTATION=+
MGNQIEHDNHSESSSESFKSETTYSSFDHHQRSYQCYTRYMNGQKIQVTSSCRKKDLDEITDMDNKDEASICCVIKKFWDKKNGELIRQEEYRGLKPSQVTRFLKHRNVYPAPIDDQRFPEEEDGDAFIAPTHVETHVPKELTTSKDKIPPLSDKGIETIFNDIEKEFTHSLRDLFDLSRTFFTAMRRITEGVENDMSGFWEGFKGEYPPPPKKSWQSELDELFEEDQQSTNADKDRL